MTQGVTRYFLAAATAVVAVNVAAAAELPSKNAKPATPPKAETCEIDGQPGIKLPDGNTCVRISGYISAGVTAGNVHPGNVPH